MPYFICHTYLSKRSLYAYLLNPYPYPHTLYPIPPTLIPVLKELMADALAAASSQLREGTVSIYTLSNGWCSGWELALTRKGIDTV
jgi:hypothetical protein